MRVPCTGVAAIVCLATGLVSRPLDLPPRPRAATPLAPTVRAAARFAPEWNRASEAAAPAGMRPLTWIDSPLGGFAVNFREPRRPLVWVEADNWLLRRADDQFGLAWRSGGDDPALWLFEVSQPDPNWPRPSIAVLGHAADAPRLPADIVADWWYVARLLALEPELYDTRALAVPDELEGLMMEAMRRSTDLPAALLFFRGYRPFGRCSMDPLPGDAAAAYAEVCHRAGRLGCFLRLHIRIMGDQFDRLAWTTYGRDAQPTGAEAFADSGVDVDRFLRGLVIELADARLEHIDPARLGRGIVDAGRADALRPTLARWAQDPGLDAFNRVRAALVLLHVAIEQHGPSRALDELDRLALSPGGRRAVMLQLRRECNELFIRLDHRVHREIRDVWFGLWPPWAGLCGMPPRTVDDL